MNTEILRNGLQVCIDWLAFTITDSYSVNQVIEFLGFDITQFSQASRGAMGYKSMYKLDGYPVSLLYDGNPGMGIHVNISGSAVNYCVAAYKDKLSSDNPFNDEKTMLVDELSYTALSQFLKDILEIGHITRLDLAVDDMGSDQYFSCQDIHNYLLNNQVVSKFRKWHTDIDYKMGGEIIGYTIYLGSRKSDVFLRIYDKRLEQNAKHPEEASVDPWTRWEFELKDKRADKAADMIIKGCSMGEIVIGVLANYVRVVELDNENRTRCSVLLQWQLFLDGIKSIHLYVPDLPKTLEDKRAWIDNQALATIIGLFLAYGGSFAFLEDNIDRGISKMKHDMKELVVLHNPDAAGFLCNSNNL